jgi:UDP-3-O-[3-hydroxymyristoyl] glucosamine N-acyltransferase
MYTVKQISECIGLDSQGDLDYQINRVTSPLEASQHHLAVAFHPRFFKAMVSLNPKAECAIIPKGSTMPPNLKAAIFSENNMAVLAKLTNMFREKKVVTPQISPGAFIAESAKIGENAFIAPCVAVGERVVIGSNAVIEHGVYIANDVIIGDKVHIQAGAKICDGARIGSNVFIGYNAIIAAESAMSLALPPEMHIGTGSAMRAIYSARDKSKFDSEMERNLGQKTSKFPYIYPLANVELEDDVEIHGGSIIHKGTLTHTRVGQGTVIGFSTIIGHNVVIGKYCVIADNVGISGSTTIGKSTMLGAESKISNDIKLGDCCMVMPTALVGNSFEPYSLIAPSSRGAASPDTVIKRLTASSKALTLAKQLESRMEDCERKLGIEKKKSKWDLLREAKVSK